MSQNKHSKGAYMRYKQITEVERYLIKSYMDDGLSKYAIAKKVKKHPSSIYREINRNTGERGYRPKQANTYTENRKVLKVKAHKLNTKTKQHIRLFLRKYWSPEQISATLLELHSISLSPLSIYRYIALNRSKGGTLWKFLRQANRKRRKKYGSTNSQGYIPNRVSIEKRPKIVDKKSRIGDWELDTVIGSHHKGVLLTLVERRSNFTLIGKCKDKTASSITSKIIELLKPHENKVKTLTLDNGKEFASHEVFSEKLGARSYFAHPYSSWERGLNENTNGLIRQFFPKGKSLKNIKEKTIRKVVTLLNYRPRKKLGFKMPIEIFTKRTINKNVALGM